MSILNIIKGCPLFYEFYDEEVEYIISNCKVGTYPKDSFLFKEGQDTTDIFVIIDGKCGIKKGDKIIKVLAKGDMLGELVLINQNKASVDIEIIENAEILIMGYDFIYGLYKSHPKLFALFFVNLSRILARRLVSSGTELKEAYQKIKKLENELAPLKKAS